MAQHTLTARTLGLAAGSLTLTHFTPQSTSDFLRAVADLAQNKVAQAAGPSPWLPNSDPQLKGTITAPSGDDGPACTFNALTHIAVTRCLVAADPANIVDTATMLREAANSSSDALRLLSLRIAARWNLSMRLQKENLLAPAENAALLPKHDNNTPLPATAVIHEDDAVLVVDAATGKRTPASYQPPTPAEDLPHTDGDDSEDIPTLNDLAAARA